VNSLSKFELSLLLTKAGSHFAQVIEQMSLGQTTLRSLFGLQGVRRYYFRIIRILAVNSSHKLNQSALQLILK